MSLPASLLEPGGAVGDHGPVLLDGAGDEITSVAGGIVKASSHKKQPQKQDAPLNRGHCFSSSSAASSSCPAKAASPKLTEEVGGT